MANDPPASFSKPGSEVRTEDKTALGPSNASAEWLSLATSRRSVPVLGHFCPGASLSSEECQGGDLETFPQLRMNGCPPNTLPRSVSLPSPPSLPALHTETLKTATSLGLSVHFFCRESLHPLVRVLSPTPSNHFIPSDKLTFSGLIFVVLIPNSTS